MTRISGRQPPEHERVLRPACRLCPACGAPMRIRYENHRTLVTLTGSVRLRLKIRWCETLGCARFHKPYRPESEGALVLLHGKMVCELKPPDVDKGRAIAAFLDEPTFAGRLPVFAGDDVTDEAGFATINERGGVSIRIGDSRPTEAAFGCANVAAMQSWLLGLLGPKAG